jgi:hypothetical protein
MELTATPPEGQPRLPAHVEVSALLRQVQGAGGFATVIRKGERDAGSLLVVVSHNGAPMRLFERIPDHSGHRVWTLVRHQDPENNTEFDDYLTRRSDQDPDLWIIELDIANGERFIGLTGSAG